MTYCVDNVINHCSSKLCAMLITCSSRLCAMLIRCSSRLCAMLINIHYQHNTRCRRALSNHWCICLRWHMAIIFSDGHTLDRNLLWCDLKLLFQLILPLSLYSREHTGKPTEQSITNSLSIFIVHIHSPETDSLEYIFYLFILFICLFQTKVYIHRIQVPEYIHNVQIYKKKKW